jgi:hypothetical protein
MRAPRLVGLYVPRPMSESLTENLNGSSFRFEAQQEDEEAIKPDCQS